MSDELGVVVGTFGDEFFIRPLQQPVELARGVLLGVLDQPSIQTKSWFRADGDVGGLVWAP